MNAAGKNTTNSSIQKLARKQYNNIKRHTNGKISNDTFSVHWLKVVNWIVTNNASNQPGRRGDWHSHGSAKNFKIPICACSTDIPLKSHLSTNCNLIDRLCYSLGQC